jgi:hypothetical protein
MYILEINAALKLLDAIEYKFIDICNLYEPNDTGLHDKVELLKCNV